MAELCKKCFIETWRPSEYDIAHIIMSDDWDICEGCGNIGPYVDHIGSDEEVYSEAYKQMLKENSENTGLNIFDLMKKNKMEIVDINMKIEKKYGR